MPLVVQQLDVAEEQWDRSNPAYNLVADLKVLLTSLSLWKHFSVLRRVQNWVPRDTIHIEQCTSLSFVGIFELVMKYMHGCASPCIFPPRHTPFISQRVLQQKPVDQRGPTQSVFPETCRPFCRQAVLTLIFCWNSHWPARASLPRAEISIILFSLAERAKL